MAQFRRDTLSLADRVNGDFAGLDLAQRIDRIGGMAFRAVFTTSLNAEDQILSWAIALSGQSIELATLKTAQFHPEAQSLLQSTRDRYGIDIREFEPPPEARSAHLAICGSDHVSNVISPEQFKGTDASKAALNQALKGADVWITGRRHSKSDPDQQLPFAEWSQKRGLLKINPLADWTTSQVQQVIAAYDIPMDTGIKFRGDVGSARANTALYGT